MPPLLRYTDPLKEVMLLKVLGEGSYATVYMGVLRATGQLCALKALKPGGGG
jgi:serine/threonine protein kinase